MNMAIIKFENIRIKTSSPSVSITSYGTIGFNGGAVKKFDMHNYNRCLLYFDPDEKKIYIELTNDENDKSSLLFRHRNPGADIGAKSFFVFFDNMPSDLTHYPLETGGKENMFMIDMKKGIEKKKKEKSQEN